MTVRRAVCLMLCLVTSIPVHAARPMITDDARITDAQACQLESWRRVNRGSREFWAFPACNPTGNFEFTFGFNDLPEASGGRATDLTLQGKTLFRKLETNGFGIGLAAGVIRHTDPAPGQGHQAASYFYVPMSRSFLDDGIVVHANLGAQNNRDTGTRPLTWGLGTEINFTPRFALIAESFGDDRNPRFYQAGVRIWVIPNRWQIDSTVGGQSGNFGATRWWTIGVRLISPALFQ